MDRQTLEQGIAITETIDEFEKILRNISNIPENAEYLLHIEGYSEDDEIINNDINIPSECQKAVIRVLKDKYAELLNEAKKKFAEL